MQALAFIEAADHVCYRYRIAAFGAELARYGLELTAIPLAPATWARTQQLRLAAEADVVILQRKLLPFWQLQLLRQAAPKLVYDFDDAVFFRDWHAEKGAESWQRLAHFWSAIYAADLVLAGNEFLRDQAATYIDSSRVRLLPTCIDHTRYEPVHHTRAGAECRLAWIGQQSTLASLLSLTPALEAAAIRQPGLELRVICDEFPGPMAGLRVSPRAWSTATEAAELADADIGVSWLPDHPWSLGKCGLKVLQYMAAGLPVVANPVGVHSRFIIHGETGCLASTPAEWAAAIHRLACDPALRAKLGAAGRKRLLTEYSVARWAPAFAEQLVQLAAAPRQRSRLPADRSLLPQVD